MKVLQNLSDEKRKNTMFRFVCQPSIWENLVCIQCFGNHARVPSETWPESVEFFNDWHLNAQYE